MKAFTPFGTGRHNFGYIPDPPEPVEDDSISVGDIVICNSKADAEEKKQWLENEGVFTEYRYHLHGKDGFWLDVVRVEDK